MSLAGLSARVQDLDLVANFCPIGGWDEVEWPCTLERAVALWQEQDPDGFGQTDREMNVVCALMAADAIRGKDPGELLDREQIGAIHIYTQESQLYSLLNARLRNLDRTNLRPAMPYLKLLLSALYSLAAQPRILYRGVRRNLTAEMANAKEQIWWSVSSTTSLISVLESPQFLGSSGPRTMLHINATHAYDIGKYSAIPGEREFILPPGSRLTVEGTLMAGDLLIVQMQQKPYKPLFPWPAAKMQTGGEAEDGEAVGEGLKKSVLVSGGGGGGGDSVKDKKKVVMAAPAAGGGGAAAAAATTTTATAILAASSTANGAGAAAIGASTALPDAVTHVWARSVDSGEAFCKVLTEGGVVGFVRARYLAPAATSVAIHLRTDEVGLTSLRRVPSKSRTDDVFVSPLVFLHKGERVVVLAREKNGDFTFVCNHDGKTGYVQSSYLAPAAGWRREPVAGSKGGAAASGTTIAAAASVSAVAVAAIKLTSLASSHRSVAGIPFPESMDVWIERDKYDSVTSTQLRHTAERAQSAHVFCKPNPATGKSYNVPNGTLASCHHPEGGDWEGSDPGFVWITCASGDGLVRYEYARPAAVAYLRRQDHVGSTLLRKVPSPSQSSAVFATPHVNLVDGARVHVLSFEQASA